MLEEEGADRDEIPVPDVSERVMGCAVAFMEHFVARPCTFYHGGPPAGVEGLPCSAIAATCDAKAAGRECPGDHAHVPNIYIEKPIRSVRMADIMPAWYAKFVDDMPEDLLFECVKASNQMDITPMLQCVAAKVASLLLGKTPEQIRTKYKIRNDFTAEEEKAVEEEQKWAEEE